MLQNYVPVFFLILPSPLIPCHMKYTVERIKVKYDRLKLLNSHLLLFYSGSEKAGSTHSVELELKENQESDKLKFVRPKVDQAMQILLDPDADIKEFGLLLNDAWNYNRSINSSSDNNIISVFYNQAMQNGALGGKLLGGDKASFIMFFAPPSCHKDIVAHLPELIHIPFQFETSGSHTVHLS